MYPFRRVDWFGTLFPVHLSKKYLKYELLSLLNGMLAVKNDLYNSLLKHDFSVHFVKQIVYFFIFCTFSNITVFTLAFRL